MLVGQGAALYSHTGPHLAIIKRWRIFGSDQFSSHSRHKLTFHLRQTRVGYVVSQVNHFYKPQCPIFGRKTAVRYGKNGNRTNVD